MNTHPVHWHEGQFLRPHHFQQSVRALRSETQAAVRTLRPYHWGFAALDVDTDMLANWRLEVRSARVRLFDGSSLRIPEDVNVGMIEIPRDIFTTQGDRPVVSLAVPRLDLGRANAGEAGSAQRYVVDAFEVDDENLAGNMQRVEVQRFNARLIVGDDGLGGFDAIPVCRLRPATTAVPIPEIDPEFVPPVLTTDTWPSLKQTRIQPIFNALSEVAGRLASQMNDRGVAFETTRREDAERIYKLHAVNGVLGSLSPMISGNAMHPYEAYRELCRSVGAIAIFKPERKLPELPAYDHDRLAEVFTELQQLLDLGLEQKRSYEKRDFQGEGLQMQVRLDGDWLGPDYRFYVGVNSPLSLGDVDRLLRKQLELKAGASDEVEQIYRGGKAGVHLNPAANPPHDFPSHEWTYWQINPDSPAWKRVEQSLHLAIRFNERQTMGSVDGKQEVTVRNPDSGDLTSLSFSLFAIPSK